MNHLLPLKIVFPSTRVLLAENAVSWDNLLKKIDHSKAFRITYTDDDDEFIDLKTEEDLQAALDLAHKLQLSKLTLYVSYAEERATTFTSEPESKVPEVQRFKRSSDEVEEEKENHEEEEKCEENSEENSKKEEQDKEPRQDESAAPNHVEELLQFLPPHFKQAAIEMLNNVDLDEVAKNIEELKEKLKKSTDEAPSATPNASMFSFFDIPIYQRRCGPCRPQGSFHPRRASAPAPPAENKWAAELKELQDLGFFDQEKNKQLLEKYYGYLPRVVNDLCDIIDPVGTQ